MKGEKTPLPLEERTSSILNLSTPEVIGFYLARRANAGIISELSAWLWSSCERWNGPTAADKKKRGETGEDGKEEKVESNLGRFFLSRLVGAWRRRSGTSHSSGHSNKLLFITSWCAFCECVAFTRLHFFFARSEGCGLISLVCRKWKKKQWHTLFASSKTRDRKSQPTASEFNWRAQMFADVQGLLRCPCIFLFSLDSYSSAAGSLPACTWGEGKETVKEESLHECFQLNSFFASLKIFIPPYQTIPMLLFRILTIFTSVSSNL